MASFASLLTLADRAVLTHLGEDGGVTYTPGVGASAEVSAVFDAAYVRVDAGEPGVSSSGPAVFVLVADLPSDPETDVEARVMVDGTEYTIHEVKKDGKGGALLLLHEV